MANQNKPCFTPATPALPVGVFLDGKADLYWSREIKRACSTFATNAVSEHTTHETKRRLNMKEIT